MRRYDVLVIGAGPAGLSAAAVAASKGLRVAVFDENARPGGQLFKQIHKFFGSKEHRAKVRGYDIGTQLLQEAKELDVEVHLSGVVMGIYDCKEITVMESGQVHHYKGDTIIVATGASENSIPFKGWTLPGVIGAGAAQTLMNLHAVKPGNRVLMVGSGNVGLVVAFQLLQAGVEVAAVIDAMQKIGGYGVHAAKVARIGVPFYLSHTILEAKGVDCVNGAVIAEVDENFKPIPGTEKTIEADTICMAVGLSPMSQLLAMAGCETELNGGRTPIVDDCQETTMEGIFAAGDVAGIEEASSAMITGRIAGLSAAYKLGYLEKAAFTEQAEELRASLKKLQKGMFGPRNKGKVNGGLTDEGFVLSQQLLTKGYLNEEDLSAYPGVIHTGGIHPVIECTQNIPCNPCQDACKFGCITVGDNITALPAVVPQAQCTGCGRCVFSCSGQAIFLVDENYDDIFSSVTMPYEFLPFPQAGCQGVALGRDGEKVCDAEIISCRLSAAMDHTALLTMKVPKEMAMKARFFKSMEEVCDE